MRYVNKDFSRAEAAFGLFWLALGALLSVLLEVVYLGTWITLPGGKAIAFPYPILIALLFNAVLSKTARLWTDRIAIAALPLWVWILGFCGLTFTTALSGDILVGPNPRSLLLLLAGLAGGAWPLLKPQVAQ
ncbi:hypothetical protein [Corynebacterium epidermidicanis]|uniref:Uncharacterized protein n=1 Tax=Corynebacterium epidermidicanis TaxID=1050174 RepID=A0A0G3GVD1_9CORY|nr:hypothetical protein [Corynebacterium epidermidicanis]AKK02807.1 hypothetical protein CEPID_04685 [Corynebacterium epidermidicanis]